MIYLNLSLTKINSHGKTIRIFDLKRSFKYFAKYKPTIETKPMPVDIQFIL